MWKFLAGCLLAGVIGFWLLQKEQEENVLFPSMQIYSLGDYAKISGSIVGEGKEDATEYSVWTCFKSVMTCEVVTVSQVAHNHVSIFDPETVRVVEWGDRSLTINSETDDPKQCNYYEVKADFETQTASYTRFPKSSVDNCAMLEQRIFNWRLADSLKLRYPETE